jgi:ABC-type phosphate transport system substrate-binding protein
VDNGTYPLARPLFIYSDAAIMADKPQVAAFLAYYLDVVNDLIIDVGYFPAPASDFQSAIDNWIAASGM